MKWTIRYNKYRIVQMDGPVDEQLDQPMHRRQGVLGYRLAFAWHFAGSGSPGNFTVITGLSHPIFSLVVTGRSACVDMLHHRCVLLLHHRWKVTSHKL